MNGVTFGVMKIGANTIPADTQNKKISPSIKWTEYQDNPISEEQFNKWKRQNTPSRMELL